MGMHVQADTQGIKDLADDLIDLDLNRVLRRVSVFTIELRQVCVRCAAAALLLCALASASALLVRLSVAFSGIECSARRAW